LKRKSTKTKAQLALKDTIIEAVLDKKAKDVVALDLTNLQESVSDYFIVCHGDSSTQVKAIAENILKETQDKLGLKPNFKEGFKNLEWIIIDYIDIVVHVFIHSKRDFYGIEELWNDAVQTRFDESDFLIESNKKVYEQRRKAGTQAAAKKIAKG
jgi:ribosome-associated protein